MFWKIVLKGGNPSGRFLAVLYARSGETIDSVRALLDSPGGMVLQAGLSRERADALVLELPNDGTVQVSVEPDEAVFVPVLMGYRPGSRGRLRTALQNLSRLSTEEVIKFLSRIPIALKLDADLTTAESIKKVLEKAGGIVEIRSPRDLLGVSSRKTPVVIRSKKNPVAKEIKKEPVSVPAGQALPPVVSASGGRSAEEESHASPKVINFTPPAPVPVSEPPAADEYTHEETVFSIPGIVRFTVPAALVPSVVYGRRRILPPPVHSKKAVLVYLFPVVTDAIGKVRGALCETLGFSPEKADLLITKAPLAVAGYSRRSDALSAMSELVEKGVPVSLVSGSPAYAEVSSGGSLAGWLSGHGSVS